MLKVSLLLVAGLLVGVRPGSAGAAGTPDERTAPQVRADRQGAAAEQASEIEKHRKQLLQPGPEGRQDRENAVHALLLIKDPRAHAVLQEVLLRGDDEDRVSRFVLRTLRPRLDANTNDPVFADAALRSQLVLDYGRVLARFFADDPKLQPAESPRALRPDALSCLRALNPLERQRLFQNLFSDQDPAVVRAGLLAAGGCRDLGLATDIAKRLGDARYADAARDALRRLTFVETPFVDEQAFLDWHRNNKSKPYVELAEEAALRRRDEEERRRREADAELMAQTVKLVRALARADNEDWRTLKDELLRDRPPGATVVYLTALRDELARKPRLSGVTADRQTLADALRQRMLAVDDVDEYAILLETVAYVTVRENATQQQAVVELLRGGLSRVEPQIRQAACRGLSRYPSTDNRTAVLKAAEQALANDDTATLREALACLHASNWRSPSPDEPDRVAWLALLEKVFTANGLSGAEREHALEVAILKDSSQELVPEVFQMLLHAAADSGQPVALRQKVLIRLTTFTHEETRAQTYLELMLDLVDDDDAEVRRHVADQLARLPDAGKEMRRAWNERVLDRLAARLLIEPDQRVLGAVQKCMLHIGEEPELAAMPIGRFRDAVMALTRDGQNGVEPFRKQIIAQGLSVLGGAEGRTLGQWTAAGRGLVELRARDALRSVLQRQDVMSLVGHDREGVVDAMRLIVEAALLKPQDVAWSSLRREAEEIRIAFLELERLQVPNLDPEWRLLRIQVLAALPEREGEVIALGARELAVSDNPLVGAVRVETILAVTAAYLNQQKLDEARNTLGGLDALGADPAEAQALRVDLADRLLRAGSADKAAEILAAFLQRTPQNGPHYRKAFLLDAEAQLALDPDGARARVRARLQENAALFQGDGVPRSLVERFEAIKRRVES